MRLPAFLARDPRILVMPAALVAAFLIALGIGLSLGGDQASPSPVETRVLAAVADSPTPTPEPTPPPNRGDCEEIRGTAYLSVVEREWYRENCISSAPVSAQAAAAAAAPPVSVAQTTTDVVAAEDATTVVGRISSSDDRLVIERLGIDAPVNYRTVEADGALGNPVGADDVVWYDFSAFRGLGGYPGNGGNAVIAGHVDYRVVGPAVFYNLRIAAEGDIISYHRGDGKVVTYAVAWISDLVPETNWNSIVARGREDTLTLITCNGQFDYARGQYSHRRVVHATRVQ